MVDHHVDRPGVDARRRVKLTGPNRPIGLIVLQLNSCGPQQRGPRALLVCQTQLIFMSNYVFITCRNDPARDRSANRPCKDYMLCIPLIDLVAMPGGPHPIPFRTRSLSLPGPMVLRLKARESRSPPGLLDGCKKTHTPNHPTKVVKPFINATIVPS